VLGRWLGQRSLGGNVAPRFPASSHRDRRRFAYRDLARTRKLLAPEHVGLTRHESSIKVS